MTFKKLTQLLRMLNYLLTVTHVHLIPFFITEDNIYYVHNIFCALCELLFNYRNKKVILHD